MGLFDDTKEEDLSNNPSDKKTAIEELKKSLIRKLEAMMLGSSEDLIRKLEAMKLEISEILDSMRDANGNNLTIDEWMEKVKRCAELIDEKKISEINKIIQLSEKKAELEKYEELFKEKGLNKSLQEKLKEIIKSKIKYEYKKKKMEEMCCSIDEITQSQNTDYIKGRLLFDTIEELIFSQRKPGHLFEQLNPKPDTVGDVNIPYDKFASWHRFVPVDKDPKSKIPFIGGPSGTTRDISRYLLRNSTNFNSEKDYYDFQLLNASFMTAYGYHSYLEAFYRAAVVWYEHDPSHSNISKKIIEYIANYSGEVDIWEKVNEIIKNTNTSSGLIEDPDKKADTFDDCKKNPNTLNKVLAEFEVRPCSGEGFDCLLRSLGLNEDEIKLKRDDIRDLALAYELKQAKRVGLLVGNSDEKRYRSDFFTIKNGMLDFFTVLTVFDKIPGLVGLDLSGGVFMYHVNTCTWEEWQQGSEEPIFHTNGLPPNRSENAIYIMYLGHHYQKLELKSKTTPVKQPANAVTQSTNQERKNS